MSNYSDISHKPQTIFQNLKHKFTAGALIKPCRNPTVASPQLDWFSPDEHQAMGSFSIFLQSPHGPLMGCYSVRLIENSTKVLQTKIAMFFNLKNVYN